MNLQELLLFAIGLSITIILFVILRIIFATRLKIAGRLAALSDHDVHRIDDDPYSLPFKDRMLIPLYRKIEHSIIKWAPSSLRQKEYTLLKLAGNPNNMNIQEWMTVRMIFWLLAGGLFTLVGINQSSIIHILLVSLIGWILGYIGPVFYLKKKIDTRKSEIESGLPYVLDILTVSVDAGLGFDMALVKVVEKTKGTLSDEFYKTLQEIKMGKSRKEALKDLGSRSGVDDLQQFTTSIIQAEQLGVRIGNVLKVQSEDMRTKRKQRAEERAMKAPIKILFPLVLFIFPAIFIVVLGPAAINILNNFMK